MTSWKKTKGRSHDRRTKRTACFAALAAAALAGSAGQAEAQATCDKTKIQGYLASRISVADPAYPVLASATPQGSDCLVRGTIASRPNVAFMVRLPNNWNSRFFFEGGAGLDGYLSSARGNKLSDAGYAADDGGPRYAVVSTNGGHFAVEGCTAPFDNDEQMLTCIKNGLTTLLAHPFAQYARFGLDPAQRVDYGTDAVRLVTKGAKALVTAYYSAGVAASTVGDIKRSYFVGCSNGGRQAMMAAKLLPDEFDGILAGAPAINISRQVLQGAVDAKALSPVASTPWAALTESDMNVIGQEVVTQCDAYDGAPDGMVSDPLKCQTRFSVDKVKWNHLARTKWWAKVDALKQMLGGVQVNGQVQYGPWLWDPGLAANKVEVGSFRSWRLESAIGNIDFWSGAPYPIATIIGGPALAYVMSPTPPVYLSSSLAYPRQFWDYLAGYDLAQGMRNSAIVSSLYDVPNPSDLDAFKASNGKLIVFSGTADGAVASTDLVNWYKNLQSRDPAAGSYAKLYLVPGMGHCGGGPATDGFDLFGVLEQWVASAVPNPIVSPPAFNVEAHVRSANKDAPAAWIQAGRKRPLCPYPTVAKGPCPDPTRCTVTTFESASQFTCQ